MENNTNKADRERWKKYRRLRNLPGHARSWRLCYDSPVLSRISQGMHHSMAGETQLVSDMQTASDPETTVNNRKTMTSNRKTMTSNRKTTTSNQKTMTSNRKTTTSNQKTMTNNQKTMTSNRKTVVGNLKTITDNPKDSDSNPKMSASNPRITASHQFHKYYRQSKSFFFSCPSFQDDSRAMINKLSTCVTLDDTGIFVVFAEPVCRSL